MIKNKIKNLLNICAMSEIWLMVALLAALGVSNSSYAGFYHEFFNDKFLLQIDFLQIKEKISPDIFINDFLMAIFFLLIGLELKREILIGELSSKSRIMLPVLGAIGGTIFPAVIFLMVNSNNAENLRGFAIPTATDIVFTYVIVKIFSNKISSAAKVFIITLAVVDDIIAILIIAVFYTDQLHEIYFAMVCATMCFLAWLNHHKSQSIFLYTIGGFLLWLSVLKSGIHPSIAGVALAMFIPLKIENNFPLKNLALAISPLVNFLILPLFAFANMGVKIIDLSMATFLDHIVLGIILGLFLGKQVGVMLFSFIAIKFGFCQLPKGSNWKEFYSLAILTGIGFTMSLFVGNLAFAQEEILDKVKIGVLFGSAISAVVGSFLLYLKNSD